MPQFVRLNEQNNLDSQFKTTILLSSFKVHFLLFRCFHSLEALQTGDDLAGEAMLSRDDRSDSDLSSSLDGLDGLDSLGAGPFGVDERTEIILAATFLVLIILAFIRLVHDFCLLISIVIRCGLIFWPLQNNHFDCSFCCILKSRSCILHMASKLEVELCQKADLNMAYNRVKVMLSVRGQTF